MGMFDLETERLRALLARQLAEAMKPTVFRKVAALDKIRQQPFYGDDSWKSGNVIRWKVPNA